MEGFCFLRLQHLRRQFLRLQKSDEAKETVCVYESDLSEGLGIYIKSINREQ